jgi:hypothetical protein
MKIFQIGFNRCGTKALTQLFGEHGLPVVHWAKGDLAGRIYFNLLKGRPPVAGLEHVVFFSDMEALNGDVFLEAYKLFPALHRHYPDALFLLNTRPVENWIRSRLVFREGEYAEWHMRLLGLSSQEALVEHWRKDWHDHHERVRAYFRDRGRFLEFDIENDDPAKLTHAIPEFALNPALYRAELSHLWKPT